jgi:vacuolar-type H+-ATPase subunit E/Vma4
MGQDALIKALEEETGREAERIIKEAASDAEAVLKEAEEQAERDRRERVEAFKKEFEKQRAAAINRASADARGLLLAERTGVMEDVFREATKSIEGLPRDRYSEFLKALYGELKKDWQTEKPDKGNSPLVHVNPGDAQLIDDPDVELVPDEEVSLGVVFVSRDGRVRLENTFSSRLKKARAEIVPRLNEMLFG